jgi:UDP-N-acetylmuramoyl-tripeptide--D-alanyl-D-alanine ligase
MWIRSPPPDDPRVPVIAATVPFRHVRFRASDAALATGGHLLGDDVDLDGASFDSRTIRPGELFVAIVAERDGHEYVNAALAAGAPAAMTSRAMAGGGTRIEVGDTAAALLLLGAWARQQLRATVVGVTGSVGKTSTKDLIAAALRPHVRVTANERSFNNEQGLPVTILGADVDTDVLVLEMGMRGPGEIGRLCDIGRPTIGVVTNVGHAHTERLGGIDGVAFAKRELVEALPPDGTAVLNADDERVAAMASHTRASTITYGTAGGADVRIVDLRLDVLARPRFSVVTPWGAADIELAVAGAHMASNAAAAIAVAGVVGIAPSDAAAALAGATLSSSRMDVQRTASGAIVIDDAYNANPTSMRAALQALASFAADRHVAVLGLMAELDDPGAAHRGVAELVADLGIELVAVGTDLYGIDPADDPVTAVGRLRSGDAVLVKASRVAGLDRLAAELLGEERVRR